jgi:hypothetical protein
MSEKNAALKKRERSANWIPTEIVLLVDLVEEELVLLRSGITPGKNGTSCSGGEEPQCQ